MYLIMTRSLICAAILCGTPLFSFGEFSANLGLTADYVWRGESQTDEEPALQGGLDYALDLGFYVGTWASNVKFGEDRDVEVDLYGGYGYEGKNGFTFDVGYIRYAFLDGPDAEEVYSGIGYRWATVTYYYDYDNENSYLDGELAYELPRDFGIAFHYGLFEFDAAEDREDYKLALSRSMWSLDFELAWHDTDWEGPIHDGRVTMLISKTW
ncbi:Bacterial protein of unknown function (Gcw_chp) [Sulfidibacter corallicola]|uniref:Outer membrane protein beta-barrel domain-containing protein n=1 Tax=Sulfidibacter corallicola TaxID=2818388 RepID=A0A8A4TQQ4_SULCO|nr:TorF family putative porin [Sulfidibacter corallicola]QTD52316.1 hypothetical protein J3U87_07560 [Sulfidibacter corallicola]